VAGTTVQLPDVATPGTNVKAAFITLNLADKVLEAFDANTNLLAHFPCSIARRVEKRPVGELHVATIVPNPNYTFDPEVFPESTEAIKTKLVLPPGPNNPVGVAWIGLDKPGYGIHGTPGPEQVGRTESHGCFRLANWNAEHLLRLVSLGTPVYVSAPQ
jgi:lipoprotein-anchoring transpeptidase ErfK/SrfK